VLRVLVDWKKLQPSPALPVDVDLPLDGCMRGQAPCAPSAGLRELLRAVRARQVADGGGWEVMVVPYGTPDWAVRPAEGCGTDRMPELEPYRAMVRAVRDVARAEGVRLRWWSPWNEPNHPAFLGPQRTECGADAPGLAPADYAELARALAAEVAGESELVLGEVAGYLSPRPTALGSAEFVEGLPRDVACAGAVWGQHAYVRAPTAREEGARAEGSERDAPEGSGDAPEGSAGAPGEAAPGGPAASGDRGAAAQAPSLAGDAVPGGSATLLGGVIAALDAKGCAQEHRVWITETGVGGPRTGEQRPTDPEALAAQCRAMDAALRTWGADPRVDLALQYTFREDPVFRVGLVDAALTTTYTPYLAWAAWARPGPPPAPPCPAPAPG
jgi:hypothetical protein